MSTWSLAVDQVRIERDLYSRVPRVFFLAARVVRGVIRAKLDLPIGRRRLPHADLVVLDGDDLARLDEAGLLDLGALNRDGRLALVARPDPDRFDRPGTIERRYRRLLFHAVIDLELADRDADFSGLAALLDGPARREVRSVLVQEGTVSPEASDREVLAEFVPVFLDLWHFVPDGLAVVFPAIDAPAAIHRAITTILDEHRLLDLSRVDTVGTAEPAADEGLPGRACGSSPPPEDAAEDPRTLLDDCRRLESAGPVGSAGRSARFLDRLRRVLLGGRDISRTDLLGWLFSAGRRPLIRRCDNQRLVRDHDLATRLLAALPGEGLPTHLRSRVERMVNAARDASRVAFTHAATPQIAAAMEEAGCRPRSAVEAVAIAKLVDELVDRMLEQGLASFADLRDAVSRNRYKLPDVTGFAGWLFRDPLVLVDRGIAARLPDVYRPAPFYLLGIQRLSAVAFGTAAGRFVTTHLVLPFGGASVALRGLAHVAEWFGERSEAAAHALHGPVATLLAGGFLWCVIHLPAARRALVEACRGAARGLRYLVVDLPGMLLGLPLVVRLLQGWLGRLLRLRNLGPLAAAAAEWWVLARLGLPGGLTGIATASALAVVNLAFARSRAGRFAWNALAEASSWLWRTIRVHFVVGLFELVVDFFREAGDLLERLLHAVQERLQVRSGESRLIVGAKAVLAAAWSVVDGFIRFCVTLLIEPQINPIKHFPVVTVSHKLLVPLIPTVSRQVAATMGLTYASAVAAVTAVSTCIPGVFGFMAWELGENWRLYAANRMRLLGATTVGRHGETIRRLLRRGFHSGTIPKAFARLRRSEALPGVAVGPRRGPSGGGPARGAARARGQLEAAAEDIGRFVEREVPPLLETLPTFRSHGVFVQEVRLATASARVRLGRAGAAPSSIRFVQDGADTILEVDADGWLGMASAEERLAIARAILGLAAMSGARTVRTEGGGRAAEASVLRPQTLSEAAEAVAACRGAIAVPPIPWADWSAAWGPVGPASEGGEAVNAA
jgi:hypothetical protein